MKKVEEEFFQAGVFLGKAEPDVAKYLRTLLRLKSKVAYTHLPPSADECKKASRAAEKLVEAARRSAKPPKSSD